jgi:predicted small metal-binding protein
VARGDTDEEVVDAIMAHMRSDHPNVDGRVARQDIFGWIEEA